jgi:hypothetical protein
VLLSARAEHLPRKVAPARNAQKMASFRTDESAEMAMERVCIIGSGNW